MHKDPAHPDTRRWPLDSAGRAMMANVPFAHPKQTLEEVQKELLASVSAHETINYIYVTDDERKLLGILSIKDLYRHQPSVSVERVCKRDALVTVHPETDQERVAYLALKHNIKAVPVVDDGRTFLGVIPSDTILAILYKEMHEDLLRLSGVRSHKSMFDNVLTLSIWESVRHRIPWLLVGLIGGIFAASTVHAFEGTLERNLILAAFIPLIVYMSDATGTQMEAFIIRDLAVDRHLPFGKYFARQLLVISSIAVLLAVLLFSAFAISYDQPYVSLAISLSLFVAVESSVFTGLLIPQLFNRLRMDPANASGPVATIIQDLLSIIIYFSVASLLL